MTIDLPGDSGDYELLAKGIELSKDVLGMTCELGVRRGGGTKIIMDAIARHCSGKVHIAIDPYGHIEYEHKEGQVVRLDYTNEMRDECMVNLFAYAKQIQQTVIFFNLEDTEFFNRFADGVPMYNLKKTILESYSFVHFDAAHAVMPLMDEIAFFQTRTPVGGCWCFDDVENYYNHSIIESYILKSGWNLIEKKYHKALYQKR